MLFGFNPSPPEDPYLGDVEVVRVLEGGGYQKKNVRSDLEGQAWKQSLAWWGQVIVLSKY